MKQSDTIRKLKEEIKKLKKDLRSAQNLALIDHLTGIPNRRKLELDYPRKLGMDYGKGYPPKYNFSHYLVVIDINDFKEINDKHGHAEGDSTLKKFVEAVNKHLDKTDGFYRVGGDEFVLIIKTTDRRVVFKKISDIGNECKPIHFSWGANPLQSDIGKKLTLKEVLDATDKLMYVDKNYKKYKSELKKCQECKHCKPEK